jgi:hypothetical protein
MLTTTKLVQGKFADSRYSSSTGSSTNRKKSPADSQLAQVTPTSAASEPDHLLTGQGAGARRSKPAVDKKSVNSGKLSSRVTQLPSASSGSAEVMMLYTLRSVGTEVRL